MLGKLLGPDIAELLEARKLRELREAFEEMAPYDIAEVITDLEQEERAVVFRILPRSVAADVFEEMGVEDQQALLSGLSREQVRRIIEEMAPDDRTAFLEELPARVTRKFLRLLGPEERHLARSLLAYPEDSVGRLMTPDYIDLRAGMTAGEALDFIRRVGMDRETVYACYVTMGGHVLLGVVELKTLVLAPADAIVADLMHDPRAMAHTGDDQEDAAKIVRDYDLLAVPVVDSDNRLVGIVTHDDLMDVLEEEASEDMQVMAGVVPETERSYLTERLLHISWRRGAPLFLLIAGQFLAGIVMSGFHEYLSTVIALTFFVPMVMATGGGTGIQTATLIVRGMSTGEMHPGDFRRLLAREIGICLIMSVVLGAFAALLAWALVQQGDIAISAPPDLPLRMAMTVSATLLLVMLLSVTTGVIFPILFQFLKLDPAVMTSPLLTTTVDILGLMIYFEVARRIFGFSS